MPDHVPPTYTQNRELSWLRFDERVLLEATDPTVPRVFQGYKVVEAALFCVTRNADITPNDEAFEVDEDFRSQMKKLLRSRTRLAPVRLELDRPISATFQAYLCDRLRLTPEQVFPSTSPLKLGWAFSLADRLTPAQRRRLTYPRPRRERPAAGPPARRPALLPL